MVTFEQFFIITLILSGIPRLVIGFVGKGDGLKWPNWLRRAWNMFDGMQLLIAAILIILRVGFIR